VKLCYICREEERADLQRDENDPPRAWTHPCNCTLIAHEDCLLKWIQSSQGTASRAPNALKCPQCGTQYELESKEPVILKILGNGNKLLQRLGRYFTVFGAATAFGIIGTSVYVCLTAYGAWAVEKFIGKEMFDLILTEDPINWPWSAYINLPLLPISLVLSRFQSSSTSFIIPLLLIWPATTPHSEREKAKSLIQYWSKPENASRLAASITSSLSLSSSTTPSPPASGVLSGVRMSSQWWPPPPILFGLFAVPLVRSFYRVWFGRLYKKVMGVPMPAPRRTRRGGLRFDEGPLVIRIRANVEDGQGGAQNDDEAEGNAEGADNGDIREVGNQNAGANANQDDPNALQNQDPDAAAVAAAEQLIEINASSLGRRVGGALAIPLIASLMGKALYKLSMAHPKMGFLRAFLGIRPGGRKPGLAAALAEGGLEPGQWPWNLNDLRAVAGLSPSGNERGPWSHLNPFQQTRLAARIIMAAFMGGTRTWVDADPVWWRNGVGFGLFIVAKDCLHLLHLYLAKRELDSRRVKDRDFRGVDIRELDLLPEYFSEVGGAAGPTARRRHSG
ncbi:hypothetical protein CVT24_008172, partial [Panaeolus cyanescens]